MYDYQTLIVGAFGFAGIIITLIINAKIARAQRNDEREHERRAIRVALLAELKINRDSLQKNLYKEEVRSREGRSDVLVVPTDRLDGAYLAFLPKIGVLSEDEVNEVMLAYLTLLTYNAHLFFIGKPDTMSPRHVYVPSEKVKWLMGMQKDTLEPIDQAINVLEKGQERKGINR